MSNAGWSWNAKADVEGTTISTYRSVGNGGKAQYRAVITIAVPANASADVIEVVSNETVIVVHTNQRCSKEAIDAVVAFVITGDGNGSGVSVSVDQVGGDNENYGSARGTTGTEISVNVAISGTCTGQNYPRQFDHLLTWQGSPMAPARSKVRSLWICSHLRIPGEWPQPIPCSLSRQ